MTDVLENIPEIAVYSGDDGMTFPLVCLGGQGVISVVSNLLPGLVAEMVSKVWLVKCNPAASDFTSNCSRSSRLPLSKPTRVPIKYAMGQLGLAGGPVRLPLVEIKESRRKLSD